MFAVLADFRWSDLAATHPKEQYLAAVDSIGAAVVLKAATRIAISQSAVSFSARRVCSHARGGCAQ